MSSPLLSPPDWTRSAGRVELEERPRTSVPLQNEPADFSSLSHWTSIKLGRWQAFNDFKSAAPFVLVDVLTISLALFIARGVQVLVTGQQFVISPGFYLGLTAMILLLQFLHGLYPACGLPLSIEFRQILRTGLMTTASLAVGRLIHPPNHDSINLISHLNWHFLIVFSGLLTFLLSASRPLARKVLAHFDWWTQPVLIAGDPVEGLELHQRLTKNRHEGLRSAGILFNGNEHWETHQGEYGSEFIGPVADLEAILVSERVCRLAIAETNTFTLNDYNLFHGIPHVMLPINCGHHPTEKSRLAERDGRVELHCRSTLTAPLSQLIKRCLDLSLVIGTMPIWLPIMMLVAICIKCSSPGPLFYKQSRIGRFRRPFDAIKFRSMVCNADKHLKSFLESHADLRKEWEATHKLKKDPRITKIGNFIRKTSLDELPQLINVLRGEMSLVGPRPIIDCDQYDRTYINEYPHVFEVYQMVRPGITGLWQISGRNALPYYKRVELDRFYLYNWSISLDIFIIWRTLKTAVFREGAY